MSHPSTALQAAIVARLSADADLAAALGGAHIHDAAPRNAAFPHITLGDAAAADWSSGDAAGAEHRLILHVWSRAVGKREAWGIVGHLMRLLHEAPLALDGHALVLIRATHAEVRREADGITTHGLLRLAALTEAA